MFSIERFKEPKITVRTDTTNIGNVMKNGIEPDEPIIESKKPIIIQGKQEDQINHPSHYTHDKDEVIAGLKANSVPKSEMLIELQREQYYFEDRGPYVLVDNFEELLKAK